MPNQKYQPTNEPVMTAMPLYLRGDSGFALPDLYEVLEDKNCTYAIRLKENANRLQIHEDF